MRIAYPKVFPLALLMVLGLLVWWLNETSRFDFIARSQGTETPDLIAFQVEGVRFDQAGKPSNKLTSSVLRHYQINNITWLTSPILEQTAEGKPKLVATGVKAKLLQNSNELFMYDKVKLVRDAFADKPMVTIDTSDVAIDMHNETAQSSSPMLAVAGQHHIKAVGFYFDHKNEILKLHKQVKVTYAKEK